MPKNDDSVSQTERRSPIAFSISQGGLAFLAVLFSLGYVSLAVWGWGGWHGFFSEPRRDGVCAALVALAGLTPLCGCNLNPGRQHEPANNWIFLPLLLLGLAMGWGSARCDRIHFWTLGGQAVRDAGLALFLLGMILRIGPILALKERFTIHVAVQEGHELHTRGWYAIVRHPSYTGAILTLFGWALVFRSVVGLALATMMVPLLVSRINAEENLLIRAFGDAYINYRAKTWRLLPAVY